MKHVNIILAGALALLTIGACSNEPDEARFAESATVTSDNPAFVADDTGGSVTFNTGDGSVVLYVDCVTDWEAVNDSPEWLEANANVNSGTLTLTTAQNTVEKEQTGTVILQTSASGVKFATIYITQNAYGAPEISVATNEWNAPAVGDLSIDIAVECSLDDYDVAIDDDSWLSYDKTDAGLTLTAAENENTNARSAKVTLTATDGIQTIYGYITVNQDPKVYVRLSPESLTFGPEADSAEIKVESNFDWDFSCEENGWLSMSRSGDVLTASVTANEGEEREAIITLTAGDGEQNVTEVQLTVTQSKVVDKALILEYTVTSGSTVILPLYGDVDCTVDWGDGSEVESVSSTLPSHDYSSDGTFDVRIEGTVTALNSGMVKAAARPFLTGVKQWGQTGLTTMYDAFWSCANLVSLPEDNGGAFSEVTTFEEAFANCSSLTEIPAKLFANCQKVTTFLDTFYECKVLTKIPAGLFDDCPKVTTFEETFNYCYALEVIPAGLFDNCTAARSFAGTFSEAYKSLTEIPEGLFDNCTNVISFYQTFSGCSKVTSIPKDLFANCTKVTTFEGVFTGCDGITTIPAGLFANCTEVTTFTYAFMYNSLTSIPANLFDNCLKVTDFSNTFYGNSSVTGESPYTTLSNGTKVHLYERAQYTSELGCVAPTLYTGCFFDCEKLSDYASIPETWTNMF